MLGDVARNRNPAAVITISAIPLVARAVEILAAEPPGDDPVLGLPLLARNEVAFGARIFRKQVDLRRRQRPSCRQMSLPIRLQAA
jgi:hypothetical protein